MNNLILNIEFFYGPETSESIFMDNWSPNFDIIGSLPIEVAVMILRKLDGNTLLNAAQVSSKWLRIIKFDRVLKKTVREELARQRLERLKRHMFLSESANYCVHEAAMCPRSKKRRRNYQLTIQFVDPEQPPQKRTRTRRGPSNQNDKASTLRKMR